MRRHWNRTTGIKNVKLNVSNFKGAFENNTLHLNGKFTTGSKYNVTILSLTGEKVASHSITGNGTHASFDVANNLPNGVYLIAVHEQNTQRIPEIIKVVKQ